MANRHRKPGPFSRDQALTNIDRRTRAGRVMTTVTNELIAHLGDATAPQRLLVQSAAFKSVRLALLTDMLLANGGTLSEGSEHHALAWLNSLRLDLQAIGLERRASPSLDLAAYLKERAADVPAEPVPADVPEAAD